MLCVRVLDSSACVFTDLLSAVKLKPGHDLQTLARCSCDLHWPHVMLCVHMLGFSACVPTDLLSAFKLKVILTCILLVI